MLRIRVLVAEDSVTVRKRLVEVLNADPELEVVGEAADGKSCVELCGQLKPDVLTVDMVLPFLSGLDATQYIMAYCPTPILIVSASHNRGDVFKTYDALAAGALDVLEKPKGDDRDGAWEQAFVSRVKLISRIKVITHLSGRHSRVSSSLPRPVFPPQLPLSESGSYRAVAIGTSTGGPAAMLQILSNLPADFPLPLLLVIHIGPAFGGYLADWLDSHSPIRVSHAKDGEPLPRVGTSRVIMAPPDRHLKVVGGRLLLAHDVERHSCRPSVDVLFESLAQEMGKSIIACLLTGMGKDGAQGLLKIRKAGGLTVAQDEASSVVFGMPQAAIHIGAAERVLRVDEIAPALIALAADHRRGAMCSPESQ